MSPVACAGDGRKDGMRTFYAQRENRQTADGVRSAHSGTMLAFLCQHRYNFAILSFTRLRWSAQVMTQKEVGYVELEWTCPTCKTRNPGTQTTCSGCGAAQPKDVQFETPAAAELIQDQAKIEQAKAGPDIHCAFCGARNAATAKVCHQCGADLTQGKARGAGQVVGAYSTAPAPEVKCTSCGMMNPGTAKVCTRCGAPLGKATPPQLAATPMPKSSGFGGMTMVFIGIAVLVVLGLCAMVFFSFRTSGKVATVQEARWERTIDVMALVPVSASAWRDQLPSGAANVSCRQEFRFTTSNPQAGAKEVCGTPYTVDTGTGVGRVVQDCEYEVYDDKCSYTTNQWAVVTAVKNAGVGFSPAWPAANLTGEQRLGDRHENYVCVLNADDKTYSLSIRSQAEYEQCQPGTRWKIEVNTFGDVVSGEPAQ
jgi:membrane protease subunit (stomatin/prohibitin family)